MLLAVSSYRWHFAEICLANTQKYVIIVAKLRAVCLVSNDLSCCLLAGKAIGAELTSNLLLGKAQSGDFDVNTLAGKWPREKSAAPANPFST